MHIRITSRVRRVLAVPAIAVTALIGLTVIAPQEASASVAATQEASGYPTYCWTTHVVMWHGSEYAQMWVPICFNGYTVWQNGNVTPSAGMVGGSASIGWHGTYNSSSHTWLGFGENITYTMFGGWASWTCQPRWYIDTDGQVYGGSMNC